VGQVRAEPFATLVKGGEANAVAWFWTSRPAIPPSHRDMRLLSPCQAHTCDAEKLSANPSTIKIYCVDLVLSMDCRMNTYLLRTCVLD
jgi:hypothetical protein